MERKALMKAEASVGALAVAYLLLVSIINPTSAEVDPNEIELRHCKGQKIAILDIGTFADSHGFASCNYSLVAVNPANGIVYTASERKQMRNNGSSHEIGTHSGPWFLKEAIRSSKYFTNNLDEADIIFVDDYCYYIWWLAVVHTKGRRLKETPGDDMMKGYAAMMQLSKWKEKQGENFVFYDSHPGFAAGNAARPYQQLKCFEIRKSVHIIVDTPMRYICGGGWPYNKLFVTPYHGNRLDKKKPAAHLERPSLPLAQRSLLAYHRATCASLTAKLTNFNAGKFLRRETARIFATEAKDVQVKCTNYDHTTKKGGGKALSFRSMFTHMEHSVFCLVLAGDAASTRRFSEIMMAGCIPTFVGPPWHSMPFAEDLSYLDAAIFLNITDHSLWLKTEMEAMLDSKQKAAHETEARWWVPDVDISKRAISIKEPQDVIPWLRQFPEEDARKKLRLMNEIRSIFSFDTRLTTLPNAVNVLMDGTCKRAPLQAHNS